MKVGSLVKFKGTDVVAMIVEITHEGYPPFDYNSFKLHVLGDALANTACADGITYLSEEKMQKRAEVISAPSR